NLFSIYAYPLTRHHHSSPTRRSSDLMEDNAKSPEPLDARAVTREAMVQSALLSAARAEEIGLPKNRMILSAKVSAVQDLIAVYRSEEHTSELQSRGHLVCRLLLEKKK